MAAHAVRREERSALPVINEERSRVLTAYNRAVEKGLIDPDVSTVVLDQEKIARNARRFMAAFPAGAKHMYAVKANPSPTVLRTLCKAGLTHFDVASRKEIALVRGICGNNAVLYYMHPKKSKSDIDFAFAQNVKGLVADSKASLEQILTHPSFDPSHHAVVIRLALPKNGAAGLCLSGKFGAEADDAAALLRRCAEMGVIDIGVSFHVGSQNHDPQSYAHALDMAVRCARAANVDLSTIDVGGGFPAFAAYPHLGEAPHIAAYAKSVEDARALHGLQNAKLLTEPGRALTADAGHLVTRIVELDKNKNAAYLNDGVYGGLFDAWDDVGFANPEGFAFPHYAFNEHGLIGGPDREMTMFGPTCDALDVLSGHWRLPIAAETGDHVAFELMGAYSQALRSDFNGFGECQELTLS